MKTMTAPVLTAADTHSGIKGQSALGVDAAVRVKQLHSGSGPVQPPPVGGQAGHDEPWRHPLPAGADERCRCAARGTGPVTGSFRAMVCTGSNSRTGIRSASAPLSVIRSPSGVVPVTLAAAAAEKRVIQESRPAGHLGFRGHLLD